jgi:mannosyltransferase OCH1-like enzyme
VRSQPAIWLIERDGHGTPWGIRKRVGLQDHERHSSHHSALCQHGAVFAEERTLSAAEAEALGHHDPLRVANYMFGSEARHPFLRHVLRELVIRSKRPIACENDVLESTGPGMLTTLYHRVKSQYDDVQLIRNHGHRCLSPYCQGQSCQFGYYASHLHIGSWRWQAS